MSNEPENSTAQPPPAAWLQDVGRWRPHLVRLAYRFCWNRDDAEDAVQNALLLAGKKQATLLDRDKVGSWLRSIVIRQCYDIRRRSQRQARQAERVRSQAVETDNVVASPEDQASRRELAQALPGWIRTLPDRQQTALVLRHLEQLSYAEIARIMKVSESTARVQVRDARENLRKKMS